MKKNRTNKKIFQKVPRILVIILFLILLIPTITHSVTNPPAPIDPFAGVGAGGAGRGTNRPPGTVNLTTTPNANVTNAPAGEQAPAKTSTGYTGLVRCDGVKDPNNANSRVCDYAALIDTANYLISWIIYIAITIALGLFIYAGFLYITGVPAHIEKAHSIFKSVVKGLIFMLLAWFIVSTLLEWLDVKDEAFTSLIDN